jgi:nocardicin N-oxygenase
LSTSGLAVAGEQLHRYLTELVALRRAQPGDDLISSLLYPADARLRLTERDVVKLAAVILTAGYETTANRLGMLVYALATDPALYQRLHDEPSLVPKAVEELLRYTTLGPRVRAEAATEDIEIGGTVVRAGEAVLPLRCSANRDETVYDRPDTVDFERHAGDHLAFGRGAHYCIGAALGRIELQVGVGLLTQRFPSIRLAVPAEQIRWGSAVLWAPEALPVTW